MKDGKRVGYTRYDDAKTERVLTHVEGSGTHSILQSDKLLLAGAGALSADGKRLLFLSIDMEVGYASLRLCDFEAKSENVLAEAPVTREPTYTWISTIAWGPDEKSLLVSLPTDRGFGVFRYSLDGQ